MAVIFSQLNSKHKHSRLFANTTRDSLRFVFVLIVSLVLIVADFHYRCIDRLRLVFSILASPLHYASDYPVRLMHTGKALLLDKQVLMNENDSLHHQHLRLQARLQRFNSIRHENTELKGLLALSDLSGRRSMGARVLAIDTNSARQLLILNKGKRDRIFSGQPVLDEHGVMGQVIDVGLMTSTVLLISDGMSAVPIRNNRTGETGILVGTNDVNRLSLIHLPKTSAITVGDLLVTSGLGRLYPEGYPVGRVDEVQNTPGDDFIKVHVSPLALLDRTRLVLLMWPDEHHALLSAQVDERLRVMASHS